MTRDETKQIMLLIRNEYDHFMPEQKSMQILKVNTWFESLKDFDFTVVQRATIELLQTFTYGTPKLAHLYQILQPKMTDQNLGQEFADRAIALLYTKGAEGMGRALHDEFGKIGYQIWLDNKMYMREMLEADIPTFKAQLRLRFNSLHERARTQGYMQLPFERRKKMAPTEITVKNKREKDDKNDNCLHNEIV